MVKQVITYKIEDSLYINVTNRCSNHCAFCIRQTKEGVGYNLWLKKEPDLEDIIKEIPNPKDFKEIVFCGYGEPMIRAKLVLEVSSFLRQKGARLIRINTNGQANLIQNNNIIPQMKNIIDIVSISLNAESASKYVKLCKPDFGEKAYPALLEFARLSLKTVNKVTLTAVDWPGIDLMACKQIADNMGVEFRSRKFTGTINPHHKRIN